MNTLLNTYGSLLSSAPSSQNEIFEYVMNDAGLAGSFIINIALAGFTLIILALLARNVEDPRAKAIVIATMLISVVSISSYTALASGLTISFLEMPAGHALAGEEVLVMWGRYLTWALSTPFILIVLGMIARSSWTKIMTGVAFTVAMCLTGLGAALTTSSIVLRWFWYALSSVFFLVIIYLLLVEWAEDAKQAGTEDIFDKLKVITVVTWFGYPVLWLVGAGGVAILDVWMTSWGYTILDVVAKYVVSVLVVLYVVDTTEKVSGSEEHGES